LLIHLDIKISEAKAHYGCYQEAIEFAGESLVRRIRSLGLIHEKTAESHSYLAGLYEKLGDHEKAKKEYMICSSIYSLILNGILMIFNFIGRGIRCKIFGERSLYVAQSDYLIGCLEISECHWNEAYSYLYRSWRARCMLLGDAHETTLKAANQLQFCRLQSGLHSFLALELKDKIHTLGWDIDLSVSIDEEEAAQGGTISSQLQFAVSCGILRVPDEESIDIKTLRYIIASAFQEYYNDPRKERISDTVDGESVRTSEDTAEEDVETMLRLLLIAPTVIKRASIIAGNFI
jgi:hypothetical protein